MAYRLGDLVVRITGDNADFKKKTGETKKEAEATGKSVGKSFDLMKVKTLAMGVASTAVFVKTIGFLKDSTMAAIEAQETFGKFDAVFADMGGAAEAAARQFMDSFDLAEVTAKQMLSATGDLLTGMGATKDVALDMSLQVNTLAADLASFTNYSGGAEGASAALTKALLGERESVKALGIVIREEDVQNRLAAAGKDKLTGAAMLQAKAEATLQIAMEQSKNAIGDYARTSDSAANTLKRAGEQTKELQVAIGTALTPSVAFLGELWGTVAGELAKVITRSNELREADKARAEGTATTDQYILSLKAEQEQLQKTIFYSKQYNQTLTGSNAEKRLAEIEQELYMRQQLLLVEGRINSAKEQQNREAQALAELEKKRIEAELAEKARITDIADARKAIYDEFLAQTAELAWQVDQDLISEKEERDGIAQALRDQITSLYDLYKLTGDESLIMGEQMMTAIAHLGELENIAGRVTENMAVDFTSVKENGIKNTLSGLSALSEALAAGELTWKSFAGSALEALAAVLEAIAAEIAALAAANIARDWFNPAVWAANAYLLGKSAVAYVAAGTVRGLAGNFEDGGIVPGSSYTGDNLTANVNSGEMIITKEQQAKLFDLLNSGGTGEAITINVPLYLDGEIVAKNTMEYVRGGMVRGER